MLCGYVLKVVLTPRVNLANSLSSHEYVCSTIAPSFSAPLVLWITQAEIAATYSGSQTVRHMFYFYVCGQQRKSIFNVQVWSWRSSWPSCLRFWPSWTANRVSTVKARSISMSSTNLPFSRWTAQSTVVYPKLILAASTSLTFLCLIQLTANHFTEEQPINSYH